MKAQDRLKHLEDLVLSLMDHSSRNRPPAYPITPSEAVKDTKSNSSVPEVRSGDPPSQDTQHSNSYPDISGQQDTIQGHFDISGYDTSYVGATHWAAILDDVRLTLMAVYRARLPH